MKKFFYDVAGAANRGALVSLLEMVATTQVLFGTDYPSGFSSDIVAGLATLGFGDADLAAINRGNALKLLGLPALFRLKFFFPTLSSWQLAA